MLSALVAVDFATRRCLRRLSRHGDASLSLLAINRRGVPVKAILSCTGVAYVGIGLAYISPDKGLAVPPGLLRGDRAVRVLPHLRGRAAHAAHARAREPELIRVRMWLYPWLTYLAMVAIVVVVGSMYFIKASRSQVVLGFVSLAAVAGAHLLRKRRGAPALTTTERGLIGGAL